MPSVKRRNIAQRELRAGQKMDLVLGRGRGENLFEDETERRELWFANRDELMHWGNYRPGHRPAAWWQYEAPEPLHRAWWGLRADEADSHHESEAEQLHRLGLLDAQERAEVEAEWTQQAARCRAEAEACFAYSRQLWKPYTATRVWASVEQAEAEARRFMGVPEWWKRPGSSDSP